MTPSKSATTNSSILVNKNADIETEFKSFIKLVRENPILTKDDITKFGIFSEINGKYESIKKEVELREKHKNDIEIKANELNKYLNKEKHKTITDAFNGVWLYNSDLDKIKKIYKKFHHDTNLKQPMKCLKTYAEAAAIDYYSFSKKEQFIKFDYFIYFINSINEVNGVNIYSILRKFIDFSFNNDILNIYIDENDITSLSIEHAKKLNEISTLIRNKESVGYKNIIKNINFIVEEKLNYLINERDELIGKFLERLRGIDNSLNYIDSFKKITNPSEMDELLKKEYFKEILNLYERYFKIKQLTAFQHDIKGDVGQEISGAFCYCDAFSKVEFSKKDLKIINKLCGFAKENGGYYNDRGKFVNDKGKFVNDKSKYINQAAFDGLKLSAIIYLANNKYPQSQNNKITNKRRIKYTDKLNAKYNN